MSAVEKALSPWGRFKKFSRRSLWKIACGVLALGLIVAHGVYAKSQASSPMRYYSMLYDVFSTGVFFRFGKSDEQNRQKAQPTNKANENQKGLGHLKGAKTIAQ